jgi:hypothetical protein
MAIFSADVVFNATVLMATAGDSPTLTTVFLNSENRKLIHDLNQLGCFCQRSEGLMKTMCAVCQRIGP